MSVRRRRNKAARLREAGLALAMTEAVNHPNRSQCPRCWQPGNHLVQHKESIYFYCNPDRGYELPADGSAAWVPTVRDLEEQDVNVDRYLPLAELASAS